MMRCKFCDYEDSCPEYKENGVYDEDYICEQFSIHLLKGLKYCAPHIGAFLLRGVILCLCLVAVSLGWCVAALVCAASAAALWKVPSWLEGLI